MLLFLALVLKCWVSICKKKQWPENTGRGWYWLPMQVDSYLIRCEKNQTVLKHYLVFTPTFDSANITLINVEWNKLWNPAVFALVLGSQACLIQKFERKVAILGVLIGNSFWLIRLDKQCSRNKKRMHFLIACMLTLRRHWMVFTLLFVFRESMSQSTLNHRMEELLFSPSGFWILLFVDCWLLTFSSINFC